MEGLMATAIALDASPATILREIRGEIVGARVAYPDVLHVEVRNVNGELWRLATQDADWSPAEPSRLVGRSVENAQIDEQSGQLRFGLSHGACLTITPGPAGASDDPPYWEVIGPTGMVLEYGPGARWQVSGADRRP